MQPRLLGVAVGLAFASMATAAQAGTIYTDKADFDAAVASLTSKWSENFEGFSTGAISGPLSIGSAQAEIFTDGPQEIYLQPETGNLAYWNVEPASCAPSCSAGGLAPQTIIRGPGSSSLGLVAISLNYNMGGVGNDMWVASFLSSAGTTNTFLEETSVSYPDGSSGQDVPLFLGWVGAPNEILQQVSLGPPTPGILVDNIRGFVASTITVKKETVDSEGTLLSTSENFDFEISPLGTTFSLNTGTSNPASSPTLAVSATESQTITETSLPPNWTLIDVTCTLNGGTPFQPTITNNSVTLDPLQDAEGVECTFTNQKRPEPGTIIVKKKTTFGDGKFDFKITGSGTNQTFQLMNGGQNSFNDLSAGQYTIEEIKLPPGWKLRGISCTDDDIPAESGNAVTVTLDENETITCTFTNQDTEDERMEEEVRRFIHRRVDNLLTYAPDRARMLRRLQEQPPPSLKDEPLKFSGRPTDGVLLHNETIIPREGGIVLHNNGTRPQDAIPWPNGISGMEMDDAFGGTSGRPTASGNWILSLIGAQLVPLVEGRTSFKFGTSLSELRAAAVEAEARDQQRKIENAGLSFADQPYTNPDPIMRQGLDIWIEGHISRYNDDIGGIDRDGDFGVLYVGADYVLAPGVLVGALVQIDDTEEDTDDPKLKGEIEGTGWMAGPYLGVRLYDNLFFDARAAWGTSDNDIWLADDAVGRRTGRFDTDRWLASASLTGNHYFGPWRFTPQLGIAYGNESYDTFANSLAQAVYGGDATIGRLTGVTEFGHRREMSDGTVVEPHVSITGIWNFDSDDLEISGVWYEPDESRAKVEGGVLVRTPRGWAVRAAGSYDGIGADGFESYSGSFWLNVPLN